MIVLTDRSLLIARHLAPQPNVSNSLFITRDHDFDSFADCATVFAAGAADAAGSNLRVKNLARAACADRNAEFAEHADHLVVRGIHVFLVRHQHFGKEEKNDSAADKATDYREQQPQTYPYSRETSEQIPRAAKPCQECRQCDEIERRYATAWLIRIRCVVCCGAVCRRRMTTSNRSMCHGTMRNRHMRDAVPVKVRQVQTPKARASEHKRKEAEAEADCETDQIEVGPIEPGHESRR